MSQITHHSSLESFHEQLSYVLSNYKNHGLKADQFANLVIGGLGGSGIGGAIAKGWLREEMPIPVEVVNDYALPGYVSDKSLVILGSYSGNTEETLSMYEDAQKRGATILVITAGGQILDHAKANNLTHYIIESGFQPRMALGYSLGFLLLVLAELIGQDIRQDLEGSVESLQDNDKLKGLARELEKKFAKNLGQRYTIICDQAFYGVAVRFQQQLNENSKCEAFVNVLPESNHNVIESYYGQLPSNFIMLNSGNNERVSARFDFVIGLLERENNKVASLRTDGLTLTGMFDIIHALDWFSIYLTEPLERDPMEIDNIISLKEYLSEI